MLSNALSKIVESSKRTGAFFVESTKLDFSVKLHQLMCDKNMQASELAEKAGVSRPYITKVFRGDCNFTIETMVKLAHAAGGEVRIEVADRDKVQKMVDFSGAPTSRNQRGNVVRLFPQRSTTTFESAVTEVVCDDFNSLQRYAA